MRRLGLVLAYAAFLVILLESASRLFWKVSFGLPFFSPVLFQAFYPEVDPPIAPPTGPRC